MANLVEWFEQLAGEETIEAAVIGDDHYVKMEFETLEHVGKLLTWAQARPLLDKDFDNGYGTPRCPPVIAWTATQILSVWEYDGATGPQSLPRNPVACTPGY